DETYQNDFTPALHDALPVCSWPTMDTKSCFTRSASASAERSWRSTIMPARCGSASTNGPAEIAIRRPLASASSGATGPSEVDCRSEEHTSELQSRENLVCRL